MKMKLTALLSMILAFAACKKDNDSNSLNDQDLYFVQQAGYSNNAEISAGNIAMANASDDSVRNFGTMMVTDHTGAQTELVAVAADWGTAPPTTADSAHIAFASYLQTLSGYQFDTTYMGAQVRDHMATVSLFQQELSMGNNQPLKDYANKYLPVIQMHLSEAETIYNNIK